MPTTTPSTDLRSLILYGGRIFNEQDGVDLMGLLDNRERKVRDVQGESFLLFPPSVAVGPTPAVMEVTIGAPNHLLKGVSKHRPISQSAGVDLSLENADSGTLTGPTVVTSGPGYGRYIVVTAEWVGAAYDGKIDENNNPVSRLIDDGVLWRTFMGAESTTPALPSGDLDTYLANNGAIPVAVVRRDFGQTTVDASTLYQYTQQLEHVINTVGTINALSRGIASQSPASWVRLIPDTPNLDDVALRKITATPVAAAAGGIIRITPNLGTYIFMLEGKLRWIRPTANIDTADLDASSTYFLRAQIDAYGNLKIYTQKGTIPSAPLDVFDTYPTDLKGTPDGLTGGGFPSTPNDLLLGKIVTGLATSVPSWTPYHSGNFSYSIDVAYSVTPTDTGFTIPVPFGCEYEIIVEYAGGNWAPTPPTANHKAFHPLGSTVHYYNYEHIQLESKGRWLEDNGSGVLRVATTTEYARPAYKLIVRPRHRTVS